MKVIGIDVAPGKGGHICDGSLPLKRKSPAELNDYLQSLPDNVLIAWDAPLTGPPDPNDWKDCKDLTTRRIESFSSNPASFGLPGGFRYSPIVVVLTGQSVDGCWACRVSAHTTAKTNFLSNL